MLTRRTHGRTLAGVAADGLENGFEGWRAAGLPLVPTAKMPPLDRQGRTVWVTRAPQGRSHRLSLADPTLRRSQRRLSLRCSFGGGGCGRAFRRHAVRIEGVFWSHRGEICTFNVMVAEFGLATEPLGRLADIVRGADTGRFDVAPQAAGLLAASLGLSRMFSDDLHSLRPDSRSTMHSIAGAAMPPKRPTPGIRKSPAPDMTEISPASAAARSPPALARHPSMAEAFWVWLRVAALSFGGPARQSP